VSPPRSNEMFVVQANCGVVAHAIKRGLLGVFEFQEKDSKGVIDTEKAIVRPAYKVVYQTEGVTVGGSLASWATRTSPSVRCNYPSSTSAVYSHSCIPTVRSFTQYNLTEH
jgi:hypothetical protein